jgi:DnaB helicase-like protein
MSDLRDSGDIEQAADVIIFPFRPVVYDPDFRPRDKAFLKVAKARDLPAGKIPVRFNAEITSFHIGRTRREAAHNKAKRSDIGTSSLDGDRDDRKRCFAGALVEIR